MELSSQLHAPPALSLGERTTSMHWIGGWKGHRASLDPVAKRMLPKTEFSNHLQHKIL